MKKYQKAVGKSVAAAASLGLLVAGGLYLFAADPGTVAIDIKPGECPNEVNLGSKGIVPVAILGTDLFDVATIDPESVTLQGVMPLRNSVEDVSTPVTDAIDQCDCSEAVPDGYNDLVLHFSTEELAAALADATDGSEMPLALSGVLLDGSTIQGQDCVLLKVKAEKEKNDKADKVKKEKKDKTEKVKKDKTGEDDGTDDGTGDGTDDGTDDGGAIQ